MRYLNLLGLLILLHSCNPQQKTDSSGTVNNQGQSPVQVNHTDTVYIVRNTDITPANSYSDLFLDTAAIDQFIRLNNIAAEDEKRFRSFYNYRNGQFAWFTSQGFTEQAKGFWNLQDKLGTKADKALRNKMDTLLNSMDTLRISRYDTAMLKTELALTNAYLNFYRANRDKTQFANISPEKAIPVKKQNTLALADSIVQQRVDTFYKSPAPYLALKQKLQTYTALAKEGGWPIIISSIKQIKKGTSSPTLTLIKKRLQKTGDMPVGDTSTIFNDSLVTVIKNYQQHNGMEATGIITEPLIRSLNVPVEKRIAQIIINLNRVQWMPALQDANYISVNIPDFLLSAFENNVKVFDMRVAVGKEGTNTTMFTGDLNQMVFSPYWNIPASIVKNEILPKMKANRNYLQLRHMEIVGKNDSLPAIRQLPGKDNALGKVKFLFPNRYDIYFHDTDSKDIFNKSKRTISHGCIRLEDAEKLAVYLLRNEHSWTVEKVHTAMNAGKEQFVKVSPAMPVVITYFTVWVDETGQLNFRDDVYANDARVGQMMFK